MALALVFLALAIQPNAEAGEVRTWTAADGRTLEAEFVSANERSVTLRRKTDRKRFTLSLDKISCNAKVRGVVGQVTYAPRHRIGTPCAASAIGISPMASRKMTSWQRLTKD